jgi:hypothetical protein
MTHDPLCPAADKPPSWEPEMCACDLIAEVRSEERIKALGTRIREVKSYADGYAHGQAERIPCDDAPPDSWRQ